MNIRPGQGFFVFSARMGNGFWGSVQTVPLKGLFKGPNPTIVLYDHGDRYQVMVDYVTVAYFEKRIKQDGIAVNYDQDPHQASPSSNTLAITAYASFSDVITRVTS